MRNIAYYNGQTSLIEDMKIPMLDRAVYFGDGVYDVAFAFRGKLFAFDEHAARFMNSCRLLDLEPPETKEGLREIFEAMLSKVDDRGSNIIYWQASRGTADRNHSYPQGVKSNLLAYIKTKALPDIYHKIKLITAPDVRYSLCNVKTINLIPNVMANEAAVRAGCDEAVLIRDGIVTECSHSNVSFIKNGVFNTAPLDCHILPGIARGHVIKLCGQLGIPVKEYHYTPDELFNADEIVVTSTTTLCRSACELDGKAVGGKAPELLEKLQKAYLDKVDAETK